MTASRTSLVVMAAGLGSRFGGVKQLAPVGPDGEVILDYTIRDGLAAGLDRLVLIVRSDIRDDVSEHIARRHPGIDCVLVNQDDLPPARDKPWGTVHAALSAGPVIEGPFVLVNADDYYGSSSFAIAAGQLERVGEHTAAIVAFELGKTLSATGAVTRGVCRMDGPNLVSIEETSGLHSRADGSIGVDTDGPTLAAETPVSMNLWAFDASILELLARRFEIFLAEHGEDPDSECLLPTEVANLMASGELEVAVVSSPEVWTGITNPDDLDIVRGQIAALR